MTLVIRQFAEDDLDAVIRIATAAWAPVWPSLSGILGPEIWQRLDDDHQRSQHAAIRELCRDETPEAAVWIAEDQKEGTGPIGFIAYKLNFETRQGEIWFLAVHPDRQNREVGTALNLHALAQMRQAGMTVAVVETGGDPSHAPARRAYEKAGFTGLPIVRYFQAL